MIDLLRMVVLAASVGFMLEPAPEVPFDPPAAPRCITISTHASCRIVKGGWEVCKWKSVTVCE